MSDWIDVKERLPEDGKTVLIASFEDVYVATYRAEGSALRPPKQPGFHEHNYNYDGESDLNPYVSHWMPLPAAPSRPSSEETDAGAME